jgi:Tol biopolymer transport system component
MIVSTSTMKLGNQIIHYVIILLFALLFTACNDGRTSFSGLIPTPRDVTSPVELSTELAHLRISWTVDQVEGQSVALVNLDGTDSQPISLPEYAVTPSFSPTTQYAVYITTLLPEADIEILDLQTQERRILVEGKEHFPGAILLNPSFSPDEAQVVFEVKWNDRIDLAVVDVTSGKVQYLELKGGFNTSPKISPDGKWILVACENQNQGGFSLCLLDQAHRIRRYLVDDMVFVSGEFTPDSQYVIYVATPDGTLGQGELYRVDLNGQNKLLLVSGLDPGDGVLGATANDAVFTCSSDQKPACFGVCVVGLDGSDVRRLTYLGERCIDVDAP